MWKYFYMLLLFSYSVYGYMARESYEYKGTKGQVHRIPYRTLLMDWKNYIRQIENDFIYEIEDFGLCNFKLEDYSQNISRTFFGYEVKGLVNYTNGFIGSMQQVQLQDNMEMSWIDEATMVSYIRSKFILNQVMLYFDFYSVLTRHNFAGTVGIPIESIEFEIKVVKNYKTNELTGVVDNASAKLPKNSRWFFEPSNKYTDIFNRDVKWNFFDDLQRLSNTTFKDLLTKVIKKNVYPELCFSCNEGMKLYEIDKMIM